MIRDRGRRAVLALEAGGWDEPLATLRAIFDMEPPPAEPRMKRFVTGSPLDRNLARPGFAREVPQVGSVDAFRYAYGPALKFEPVVDPALLRRFNRTHPSCIACGSRDGVAGHHVIYKSVLRLDLEWNLIPLCGRCHLNAYPESFHRLGGRRWLRLNRRRLPRYVVRNLIVVLFVIEPWIQRRGREGPTLLRG